MFLGKVCIIIYIGTNGSTFIDTAALIACLSNFPSNQATAVGLLKGFTGICGAIFNQLYASFLAPDTTSFILLIAIGPTVVVGPFILMMGSGTDFNPEGSENDDLKFQLLCGAALLVGAYMLCVTLVQDFLTVSKAINIILTVVLFGMLLLPLAVPRTANWLYKRGEKEANTDLEEPLLVDNISADEGEDEKYDGDEDYNHDIDNDDESEYGGATSEASDDFANEVQVNGQSNAALFDGPKVSRGPNNVSAATGSSEITLSKAFRSLNYWLLFFSILFSMGSGITAFNNLGQVAEAQGYTSAQVFVSMVNIWNFVGRLGGGYISEILTRDYGYPRTMLLAIAQVCMALGHVLFATALPGSLYVAILFVAVGYGSLWSVFPTALSELFGLMNFGVLYNFGTMASPCGSLVYSTFIAGPVYDWHAKIQGSSTCEGRVCFELTFFVLAGACLVASALSTILSIRTRKLELPQNDYRSHGHSYLIRNTSLFSV
ncbi:hypothetical protein KP509_02G058700 [Ceratopteris richardii]|uniref:Nodulin-like domain-containing protein n=1 Tax=Ceratopteris richardii TaxID=49495 RepID=A0A8T2VHQ3_CERRI|nr:hypothetical protein KP509_02G058700 [Ceratopteris richardii]